MDPAGPPLDGQGRRQHTPAQAVFGSPLILPGQFLDSPELPSEQFLGQFSKTLSAAEHPSTIDTTPPLPGDRLRSFQTPWPMPRWCLSGGMDMSRHFSCSTTGRSLLLPPPFHPAYWRQGGQSVNTPPHSVACAAQG
jgi:hypothetical protein